MIKDLRIKKGKVLRKMGFTLVEILIVISILSVMIVILIGTIDPIALVNKAHDSRRKSDLNKIKIAFEEYHRDKGSYPSTVNWNITDCCDKLIPEMASYLKTFPCDPKKKCYQVTIVDKDTYKVTTNLDNKKDKNIPTDWYNENTYPGYKDSKNLLNYGVSSSNILWYDLKGVLEIDPSCGSNCIVKIGSNSPEQIINGICVSTEGNLCFRGSNATGNNFGVTFPDVPPEPQCYVENCCDGRGCN